MNLNFLIKNTFIYTIGTIIVQGFSFFTLPIFSKMLEPSDFGYYASFLFLVSIMTIIIGVQVHASINNAYLDYGRDNIFKYSSGISIVAFFSLTIVLIIFLIFNKEISELFELPKYVIILGIVQGFFIYFFNNLSAIYRILDQPIKFIILSILNVIGNIVLSVILIHNMVNNKYMGRVISSTVIIGTLGLISAFIIYSKGKNFVRKEYLKYALKFSIPLIFHSIAAITFTRCDQLMIMKLLDPSIAGIYNYASNFGHIMYVLYSATNQAFVPWYYKMLNKKQILKIEIIFKKYMLLMLGIYIELLMIIPEIIYFMSDRKYYFSVYLSPLIIFSFFINFLYTFPVNYEFYNKKTIYITIGTVICSSFNLVTNYFLIPKLGIYGAAITTIFSYLLLLLLHLYIVKYIIKNYELNIRIFFNYLIIATIFVVLYYIILDKIFIRILIFILVILFLIYYIWKYIKNSRGLHKE